MSSFTDKLNDRIRQLLGQVENLEKQLNVSQSRIRDLASDKGVAWLDSMLSFCKYALPIKVVNYVTRFTTKALKIFRYSRAFRIVPMGVTLN